MTFGAPVSALVQYIVYATMSESAKNNMLC